MAANAERLTSRISEQRSYGLAGHSKDRRSPCSSCGTPCTLKICSISSFARTPDSWASVRQHRFEVAGVDVDQSRTHRKRDLNATAKFGDVPAVHLLRCGRDQLRAHLAGVPRQPAAFGDHRVLSQHPVHRGHRTQIDALVEPLSVDLQRREIDELRSLVSTSRPLTPFGIAQSSWPPSMAGSVHIAGCQRRGRRMRRLVARPDALDQS